MKTITILYLILFPLILNSQTIDKIKITGAINFDEDEYVSWCRINSGSNNFPGIIDSAVNRILVNLTDRGYFHSKINQRELNYSPDSQKVNLVINLHEGEAVFVNDIIIEKSDSLKANIKIYFDYLSGQIFNKFDIENNISELLNYFEETGHPFAKVTIRSLHLFKDSSTSKNLVNIFLKIDTGKNSRIDKVEIQGNSKTKEYVILRDARISNGNNYSQKEIDEIPKKLNRLRFFEPVETPSFYFNSKDEGVLLIAVKEKETNNFDGLIGYVPSNTSGSKGYVTGLVNVSLRNLFGTGRAAAIKWQRIDRYSQELNLKYLEPWLFGFPFNINLELYQLQQDTSYVQRKVEGSLEFLATENFSASFILSSESIIPTENENSVFTVYNSSLLNTGVNLKIDTRDDFYAPTEGIYFLNSYIFSQKKINGPEEYLISLTQREINLQKFAIDFNMFYQIFKRNVAALGIHGREMRGSFFEVSDLFKLGGTNTLRGYRENQFLGNRLLWTNLEYRVLLTKRSYVFTFFDAGYYFRSGYSDFSGLNVQDITATKLGYGLGMNIETGLGVLSVSYALGKGDSFSDGKIHFGLINEF